MPLQDHFRPPLRPRRDWHSFHSAWASSLAFALNEQLPPGYFAEPNVQYGIEIDVAAFDDTKGDESNGFGFADWTPPQPVLELPLTIITDIVEVRVIRESGGATLVAAIEILSPSNKDRPSERDAFVFKCLSYLQQGAGLLLVDIVTTRKTNLHREILKRLRPEPEDAEDPPELYGAAYRPFQRAGATHLEVWEESLALRSPMPKLPLCLRGGGCVAVDLDATYERTCQLLRITSNSA